MATANDTDGYKRDLEYEAWLDTLADPTDVCGYTAAMLADLAAERERMEREAGAVGGVDEPEIVADGEVPF